ncbi:hypothetical protein [Mycolicibacterium sp.]|uniref:hypothetical protein n=1 Tax=Mycolicibacterium sp. TaxID=2320850 RepID=UPI00355F36C8
MTTTDGPTYFRPTNSDTGELTLTTYFTAALCELNDAHQFDLEARTDELAADVRDHLDKLDIAIRPTIKHGRVRILQESDPGEDGINHPPEVHATVMAFLTDAEPDDPRLALLLAGGFRSGRLDADVVFEIPTVESEAELEASIAADNARGAEYVAKASSAQAAEARHEANPYGDNLAELFD